MRRLWSKTLELVLLPVARPLDELRSRLDQVDRKLEELDARVSEFDVKSGDQYHFHG